MNNVYYSLTAPPRQLPSSSEAVKLFYNAFTKKADENNENPLTVLIRDTESAINNPRIIDELIQSLASQNIDLHTKQFQIGGKTYEAKPRTVRNLEELIKAYQEYQSTNDPAQKSRALEKIKQTATELDKQIRPISTSLKSTWQTATDQLKRDFGAAQDWLGDHWATALLGLGGLGGAYGLYKAFTGDRKKKKRRGYEDDEE